ncbi:30S ribosomal protein S6--L-glutamate ligase [Bacteriovorax sp. DB6_IX]|uniref:30S ribosomal protein S6--L-glutamate ligase n=1 Tax=Bacteriovorax sp. DB6_IX TaxID=1353530 RepID=UPI00038A1DDE|nr:30S ribosomal protein S6--L-glutamate ligase [Bacteriovorax sp. DB6_IX]EQC52448.1 glutathione synthetase, ATP-binding domain protein [Bacteriovorax sp. DB6_IX]
MKLAILSRSSKIYSTKRLLEAAKSRGHKVQVLDTLQFALDLEEESPDLYYKRKRLSHYDAIIPRIGTSVTYYGTAVVRQFQQMDVFSPSSADGIINSRDKLRSFQILSRHKIGIPATTFVRDKQDVLPAIERVGGVPIIIKLIEGTQGIGVLLAYTLESALSIIELFQSQKQNILIQKFVAESKGKDIRAIVVGDQVVASMRRVAQGQEFRSNVHRGGKTEKIQLDPAYEEMAIKAAKIMGLGIAGVDMLESKDGPQIMEINSSPGLEGIEACTKIDVAGAMIDYIDSKVGHPEIDLRERLSVSKGYGIAEIVIPKGSEFVGRTIFETMVEDRNLNALTLHRGGKVIPNPKLERELKAKDKVLCFGKMELMRDLIPEKVRKRRKPKPKRLKVSDIKKATEGEN